MVDNLVTLSIDEDGLHVKLEPKGREYLESEVQERDPEGYPEILFKGSHQRIMLELLERYSCNGGPELLSPETDYVFLGAMTEAPIIAFDVERDDQGELIRVGRMFWYPQYMVKSELEELLNDGETVFQESE